MRAAALYRPQSMGLFGENRIDFAAAADSYSCDLIGMANSIRRPFEMDGARWVCVGTQGNFSVYTSIRIYKLTPAREFGGVATTYREKVTIDGGEFARRDPLGFYHGMEVSHVGKSYVLTGPEWELLAEPTKVRAAFYEDEEEWTGARDPRNDRPDSDADDFELDYEDEEPVELTGEQLGFEGMGGGEAPARANTGQRSLF